MKILSNTITTFLIVILITLSAFVLMTRINGGEPEIFGHQLKVVLSGSMEPAFKTGSVIAVEQYNKNTPVKKDDIITFIDKSEKLITHRIVDIVESGEHTLYKTKGDNNNAPDNELVQQENIIAIYKGVTIPYLGYLINYTQTPANSALLLIIPGIFLIGYGGFTIIKIILELEKNSKKPKNEMSQES